MNTDNLLMDLDFEDLREVFYKSFVMNGLLIIDVVYARSICNKSELSLSCQAAFKNEMQTLKFKREKKYNKS